MDAIQKKQNAGIHKHHATVILSDGSFFLRVVADRVNNIVMDATLLIPADALLRENAPAEKHNQTAVAKMAELMQGHATEKHANGEDGNVRHHPVNPAHKIMVALPDKPSHAD